MRSGTRDKAEGRARNIAGSIKAAAGRVLGNPRLQAEGNADQVEGRIQKKVGDIKKVLGN